MTSSKKWLTSALVFADARDVDIVAASNRLCTVLESLGEDVSAVRILSDDRARVTTPHHEILVERKEDQPLPSLDSEHNCLLGLAIARGEFFPKPETPRIETVLARALGALQTALDPDYVQWHSGDTLLTGREFAKLTRSGPPPMAETATPKQTHAGVDAERVRPTRPRAASSLPNIEETNEILQARMSRKQAMAGGSGIQTDLREIFRENSGERVDPAEIEDEDIEHSAPRRLSAWLITIGVSLFALPVGAALLLLNLVKGENLRLASQTAALTGMFMSLSTYGASAEALSVISAYLQ